MAKELVIRIKHREKLKTDEGRKMGGRIEKKIWSGGSPPSASPGATGSFASELDTSVVKIVVW